MLSNAFINRAILREKSVTVYQCERLPCLRCRISGKGASWYINATIKGVRVRKSLGRYPNLSTDDALIMAWQLITSLPPPAQSSDKIANITEKITFGELLPLYAKHRHMKQSTINSYEGFLRNSDMSGLFVSDLTPKAFLERFNALFTVYPVKARKVASIVKSLTRWYANYSGVTIDDPTKLIGTIAGVGIHSTNCRTRRLSAEQLPLFWIVLNGRNELERDALTFCLLTAMRKNEVIGLTRDNITESNSRFTVTLPTTKNGKPHSLPLVGVALVIVKRRLSQSVNNRLFPTQCKHAFNAVNNAGIALSWHDLRRTWASLAVSNGVNDSMVKRVLNHSAVGVTARHYAHFDDESVADTLLKIERVLFANTNHF